MAKQHPSDMSNEELAAMVSTGFTRMQEYMDGRFDKVEATQEQHTKILEDHSKTLEEHGGQLTGIRRKQDSEIEERDREQETLKNHEERLHVLEGKPA